MVFELACNNNNYCVSQGSKKGLPIMNAHTRLQKREIDAHPARLCSSQLYFQLFLVDVIILLPKQSLVP